MRLLLAIALACALLAANGATMAHADSFPGERPAGPQVVELVGMATAFWAARDVTGCPDGITAMQAPSLDRADGGALGRGGDCEIWITDYSASDFDDQVPVAAPLRWDCIVIFHEVGHALGLPHSPTGLMSVLPDTPWDCRVWVRARLRAAASLARAAKANTRPRAPRASAPSPRPRPLRP